MRLKTLELTNFRQHAALIINFIGGLNIVRMPNEAGKTSTLEGLAYNWFGADALPEPLADVVLWGEKPRSLATKSSFVAEGATYTCTRSPAGAEIWKEGGVAPLVTGQREVTMFIETLLGMPKGRGFDLLIAEQNGIRGIVEKGGSAVAELIEKLADFRQVTQTLDLIMEHFSTGSTKAAEGAVAAAQEAATRAEIDFPELQEPAEEQKALAQLKELLQEQQKKLLNLEAEQNRLEELDRQNRKMENAQAAAKAVLMAAEKRLEVAAAEEKGFQEKPDPGPEIEKVEQQLEELQAQKEVIVCLNTVAAQKWDGDVWKGPVEDLQAAEDAADSRAKAAALELATAKGTIAALQKQIHTGLICEACKRPFENAKALEEANSEIQKKIAAEKARIAKVSATEKESLEEAATLRTIITQHNWQQNSMSPWGEREGALFSISRDTVPYAYAPAVETPVIPEGKEAALFRELGELDTQLQAFNRQEAERERLRKNVADAETAVDQAKVVLAAVPAPKTPVTAAEIQAVRSAATLKRSHIADSSGRIQGLESDIRTAAEKKETNAAARARAAEMLMAEQKKLSELRANNALLKESREARIKVSDYLWNLVLGPTSIYFSKMRGIPSNVTKDGDRFLVNGRPAKSLSGSAKDLLGLATRFALMRTFLPGIELVALDEPAAACSDERANLMTGMITTAGFPQQILITHRAQDEGAASNFIEW